MWKHKKIKGNFKGSYEYLTFKNKMRERVFMLTSEKSKNGSFRRVSFESWQEAKAFGWIKK